MDIKSSAYKDDWIKSSTQNIALILENKPSASGHISLQKAATINIIDNYKKNQRNT